MIQSAAQHFISQEFESQPLRIQKSIQRSLQTDGFKKTGNISNIQDFPPNSFGFMNMINSYVQNDKKKKKGDSKRSYTSSNGS